MNNLFLRAHSIEEWRTLSQTTHVDQMARLLRQAKSYESYLPPAEHPRDSITYIGMAAANMALAYALTEDDAYLETLRRWIKVGIGSPPLGIGRMPDHDLDAAWLLFGLCLGWRGIAARRTARLARQAHLARNSTLRLCARE